MPVKAAPPARRSTRVTLRVPLRIYEPETNNRFLLEQSYAVKVSLWGGLIALKSKVNRNQQLVAVNQSTGTTAESRIVYLGPLLSAGSPLRLVAIEFLRPSPGFLGSVLPPPLPSPPPPPELRPMTSLPQKHNPPRHAKQRSVRRCA